MCPVLSEYSFIHHYSSIHLFMDWFVFEFMITLRSFCRIMVPRTINLWSKKFVLADLAQVSASNALEDRFLLIDLGDMMETAPQLAETLWPPQATKLQDRGFKYVRPFQSGGGQFRWAYKVATLQVCTMSWVGGTASPRRRFWCWHCDIGGGERARRRTSRANIGCRTGQVPGTMAIPRVETQR